MSLEPGEYGKPPRGPVYVPGPGPGVPETIQGPPPSPPPAPQPVTGGGPTIEKPPVTPQPPKPPGNDGPPQGPPPPPIGGPPIPGPSIGTGPSGGVSALVPNTILSGRRKGLRLASEPDLAEFYSRIRFNYAVGGSDPNQIVSKSYEATGDTLFVAYLSGNAPVYVRLGSPQNPWIRVREGMTLRRYFTRVAVRVGTAGTTMLGGTSYGDALFFVSFGELVTHVPPKEYGLRRGFYTKRVTATTGTQTIGALLGFSGVATWGRHGGTLVIKNVDLANSVYFAHYGAFGGAPSSDEAFPIGPGETFIVPLEHCLEENYLVNPVIFTLSGTASVAILVTADETDLGALNATEVASPPLL